MQVMANMIVRIGSRSINAVSKFRRVLTPRFQRFGALASVEMAVPSRAELITSIEKLKNADINKIADMTVNEIAARGLVLTEIAMWFYVGEIIGRGSLIGYTPKIE